MEEAMNAMQRLNALIEAKNSRVCAGLDPTWELIPESVKNSMGRPGDRRPKVFSEYCKQYIDAVADVLPAVKINSAFFEREGYEWLYFDIADYASQKGLFVIGDVKRADIGNTSNAYAEAYLGEYSPFDAITINPYFGSDGIIPFLDLAKKNNRGVFILVKTSNKSSAEIQDLELADGRKVYQCVAERVREWAMQVDTQNYNNYPLVGAVVGATHPEEAKELQMILGKTFLLLPGYGAQGATAQDVAVNFDREGLGAIVNSSRGIMNAYKKDIWKDKFTEKDWAEAAREEAKRASKEINDAINRMWQNDQPC